MTDLHTHILPGMDDGAADLAESLALLKLEAEQGVDTVVLTPHFYRERENPGRFLERRKAAFQVLEKNRPPNGPNLLLGAEVAWYPTLADEARLEELCLGGTKQLLLELPFQPWTPKLLDQIYNFASVSGLTPVFAHVERYARLVGKERLEELMAMGFPMQMNADSLLDMWSRRRRRLEMLRRGRWYLGSDCHNLDARPPRLGRAAAVVRVKLGAEAAGRLLHWRARPEQEGVDP